MQNDIMRPPQPQPPAPEQPDVQPEQPVQHSNTPVAVQPGHEVIDKADTKQQPIPPENKQPVPHEELPIHTEPRHVSRSPNLIIVTAVVVCLLLVGSAFYLGTQQTEPGESKTNTGTTQSASPTDTNNTVDSTIEAANGLPDDTVDPTNDLSDQALGL